MKKLVLILIFIYFIVPPILYSQDLTVLPGGVLEKGDSAHVTGDYVRVRSGPSLQHRILLKVNSGTAVSVLQRGGTVEKIGNMENYWYQIKIDESGTEGWMYGAFLEKDEKTIPTTPPVINNKPQFVINDKPQISLKEIGSITQKGILHEAADLNQNGTKEILLLHKEDRERYLTASGYEPSPGGFTESYKFGFRNTSINNVTVFDYPDRREPIIAASGDNFTYFYNFDIKRLLLRLIYKLDTPQVGFGMLDGKNPYIVYLKKNKIIDNDGTLTYYIVGERIEYVRGRLRFSNKVEYEKPLPVKKLVVFDLDNDKRAEIISEIGGNGSGGGITVLQYTETGFKRIVNTGIPTYNNSTFIQMWGIRIGGKPKLVIYSTDPEGGNEVNSDFGFISASLQGTNLLVEDFMPVNKRLDDINNYRWVLPFDNADSKHPFLFLDFNQDEGHYVVKKVILN